MGKADVQKQRKEIYNAIKLFLEDSSGQSFQSLDKRSRNEIWLDKVLSSQENQTSVFIAAGFSHFQGPFNMLGMLQEEGFFVKRLDSNCQAR